MSSFHRLLLCALVLLAPGGAGPQDIVLLESPVRNGVVTDPGGVLIVSVDKALGETLCVSTEWEKEKVIPLGSKKEKESFAREFFRLVDPGATIGRVVTTLLYFRGAGAPDTLTYRYTDTVSIRVLWQRKELSDMVRRIQTDEAPEVLVRLRGWKDSLFTTSFDDPADERRAMFKIPVRFLPGANSIYLAPGGRKGDAFAVTAELTRDHAPVEDRSHRFHNSVLEQSCSSCHEGLPSAGAGASADCASCHRPMTAGAVRHAPVEMNSCTSCHSWSAEKNAVVVEKGGSSVCTDCHVETATAAASSTVPHVVAAECLTCHEPHTSDRPRLLKAPVFELCTGCHDGYTINHPVGRHPLRFAAVPATGEEISCASCHLPHGSAFPSLLKVEGGAMMSCLECHQR